MPVRTRVLAFVALGVGLAACFGPAPTAPDRCPPPRHLKYVAVDSARIVNAAGDTTSGWFIVLQVRCVGPGVLP